LTLDVDATIVEADKGAGQVAYDRTVGYQPMLGFLSNGRTMPRCSFVKFRPGNASPQANIEEAITRTLKLVEEQGRSLEYFRSDSAGYQSDVIDVLDGENISYTITADQDEAVDGAIEAIPEGSWEVLLDPGGIKTGREVSETVHTMNDSDHAFRLVVWRKQVEEPNLFGMTNEDFYRYGAVITNVSGEEMSAEEVLHHHRGRVNAERFIGEAKSGAGLRHLPCGQERANRIGVDPIRMRSNVKRAVPPFACERRLSQDGLGHSNTAIWMATGRWVFASGVGGSRILDDGVRLMPDTYGRFTA